MSAGALIAAQAGLHAGHAAAARRLAERREEEGKHVEALRHWALSLLVEPADSLALHGVARCTKHLAASSGGRGARPRRTGRSS
jgi:hypothetical protein